MSDGRLLRPRAAASQNKQCARTPTGSAYVIGESLEFLRSVRRGLRGRQRDHVDSPRPGHADNFLMWRRAPDPQRLPAGFPNTELQEGETKRVLIASHSGEHAHRVNCRPWHRRHDGCQSAG